MAKLTIPPIKKWNQSDVSIQRLPEYTITKCIDSKIGIFSISLRSVMRESHVIAEAIY